MRPVRTLDPDNLERWISSWKRWLKEPENLQMGTGIFVNAVEAALGELKQAHDVRGQKTVRRGTASWGSKVLSGGRTPSPRHTGEKV